jgi:hypothetical protein
VAESEAREAILEAAPTSEAAAVNLNMLLMVTDLGRTTAQKAIESLLEAGKLRRTGEGVKGSPYRYWRPTSPEDPPDEPPSGGDQMLPAATDTLEGAGNKTDASSELTDGNTDEPLSTAPSDTREVQEDDAPRVRRSPTFCGGARIW